MNASRTIQGSRNFSVAKSELFEVFADPQSLIQWWGPNGFTCTFDTFDFKVGGEWIYTMHAPDGTKFPAHAVFDEIVENSKIVMHHTSEPKFTMTMLFEDAAEGSLLTWIHEFESQEILNSIKTLVEQGRKENFDRLADFMPSSH